MKIVIFFILCIISVNTNGQRYTQVLHGDTLWLVNLDANDSLQLNKFNALSRNDTSTTIATKSEVNAAIATRQPLGTYVTGVDLATSNATERTVASTLSSKTILPFNFAVDLGANDTYVITLTPALVSYTTGQLIIFKANTVNTGTASLNVNGLGAKTIVKRVSTTLANGDIPALQFCVLVYNGTNFVLINPVVN